MFSPNTQWTLLRPGSMHERRRYDLLLKSDRELFKEWKQYVKELRQGNR